MRIRSIRTRLLLAFLALAILPAGLIGLIVGWVGQRDLKQQVERNLQSVVRARRDSMVGWLAERERALRVLLTCPEVQAGLPLALDPQRRGAGEALQAHLQDYVRADGMIDELFLLNSQGWVVAASDPRILGEYRGLQAYFGEGLRQAGTHMVAHSYSSLTEGVNALITVTPIRGAGGNALGVLASRARLAHLSAIMKTPLSLGRTAETYLVGANHILLSETKRSAMGYRPGGTYVSTPAANAAIEGRAGVGIYTNYSGHRVIGAYVWVPELRVGLLGEQTTLEAFQPVRRLMWSSAAVALLAVLAAVAVAVLLARNITRPLEHLVDTATRIAGGELELRARVERGDEVGTLASAFNAMTGQLRTLLVRIQMLLDTSKDAIFIHGFLPNGDPGCFLEVNRSARGWVGRSREELKVLTPYDVAPSEQRESLRSLFERLLRDGHAEITLPTASAEGQRALWEISAHIAYVDDRPMALTIARDVAERTRVQALSTATEGILAKGRMAAYVAHEINSPLAGIKNAFMLVSDAIAADHPHYKYVDLIRKEINRIGSIVRMMYELYRPGIQAPSEVLVEALLQDVETLLEPKARAQQVELRLELPDPALRATLAPDLLRQILINLLQNAMEASPPGGLVRCRALRQGDRLSIQVVDEGPGINAELAPRIFDPGFSTKYAVGTQMGLGLGLGSSRRLAEGMGGTLAFANNPGARGCTFTLELPLTQPFDSEE